MRRGLDDGDESFDRARDDRLEAEGERRTALGEGTTLRFASRPVPRIEAGRDYGFADSELVRHGAHRASHVLPLSVDPPAAVLVVPPVDVPGALFGALLLVPGGGFSAYAATASRALEALEEIDGVADALEALR